MALVDSLKRSSINIENISKSLSSTKKSVSSVNDSVDNISNIISRNTRVKRELFSRSEILDSRRREASRRREVEDQLESAQVSTSIPRGLSFASKSDKGPLGRLLGFLGFITAGWIAENLPTWIFMGKEFISRIQTFGTTMFNMVDNMKSIINAFGYVLTNSFTAITSLNFNEFTEGSVAKSFDELNLAVQGLGDNITDTFKLFTVPLTESMQTGEEAPGLGEEREETMFPGVTQEGAPSKVTGTAKQALDIISKYESAGAGYNAMNQGTIPDAKGQKPRATIGGKTSKDIIGKNLTDMTIGEVIRRQDRRLTNDQGFIHAAGRYQIIGNTLPSAMRGAGLKPTDMFSPENQDKMGIYLLKSGGPGKWVGLENATKQEMAIVQQARREPVSYVGSSTSQTQIKQVPVGNIKPLIGDRLGAGRNHGGVDLQVPSGTPLRAISDGIIVDSDYEKGWGNFLVMKDNLGIYHLYGHMQSGYKKGGPVKKGEVIGKVGMTGRTTGPHLHWETGTGWNGGIITGKFDALNKYSKYAPFNTTPSAKIESKLKTQQPSAITPQRKGSQVVIVDDTQPQVSQTSYPPQQLPSPTPSVSDFKLLNNFIKNKLLIDLAYL